MKMLLDWLDDRTGYRDLMHEALYEHIPGGARWRYVWGSTLVFTFAVQVITGFFLWTAYSPSAQTAWESVYYIQYVMQYGWLVRGMHHFAAQAMVVLLALHLMQVIIDGAYKAPREVNFWLGLILMQIVLGLSLTGYLLPWDQKGYYATQVSTEIMGATPMVGPQLQQLVQGGPEYGHHTLTRFFAMHAGILPGLLVAFLALHIYVFRRHGITVPDPDRAPATTFWPDQVLKDAVACLAVLMTVLLLTVFKGAELSAPADPSEAFSAARPEWYFLFLFRFLKYEAVEHMGLPFGAIYVPGALMTVLVLMPLIARWKLGHRVNVGFMWVVTVGIIYLTGLAWYEDNYSEEGSDFRAAVAKAHADGVRVRDLAQRPEGIPAEGAVSLLQNDPMLQGPKIFAENCAACHRYNGHDGMGNQVVETDADGNRVPAQPTAADLGNFGSRDWLRAVLTDYKSHFAPLANARWEGESVGDLYLEEGEMADWSEEHREMLLKPANRESLDALIEFLISQSGRSDIPPVDETLVAKGREIFEYGELADGEFSTSCIDCHALKPTDEEEVLGYPGAAPVLTQYASSPWLKQFIANPSDEANYGYGEKNAMPAFGERLSERQMNLLVDWMVGDYYKPGEAEPASH